jgi:hypothetical protein
MGGKTLPGHPGNNCRKPAMAAPRISGINFAKDNLSSNCKVLSGAATLARYWQRGDRPTSWGAGDERDA